MDVGSLTYPRKSHRKPVHLPEDSQDLAEFLGIEFGDGGIGNPWQVVVTLNSEADLIYSQYVSKLIKKLFHISVVVRKRKNGNALQIVCSSTSIVDFLVSKGAVRGNKIIQKLNIPRWVCTSADYEKAFVRGLVDTDGCLYIHRHTTKGISYANIGFCFTSFSRNLLFSVANIFQRYGIKPHITDSGRRIYLYEENSVLRYLRIFGSSNPRIFEKYREWKGAGVV